MKTSREIKNLKIVINNDINSNESDSENMLEIDDSDSNQHLINAEKALKDDDLRVVLEDSTEIAKQKPITKQDTEFHINLDKVPPSLQNTVLVSLIKNYKLKC
jgi:hypothetical protein